MINIVRLLSSVILFICFICAESAQPPVRHSKLQLKVSARCFSIGLLGHAILFAGTPFAHESSLIQPPTAWIARASDGLDYPYKSSIELESAYQISRVMYSLDYVYDDINKGISASEVTTQIKSLLSNYKLRDNIRKTLALIPTAKRDDAYNRGVAAIEDLSAAFEYFNDGGESPSVSPREMLSFAQKAILSAKDDLRYIINDCLPGDISQGVNSKVAMEFNTNIH